MTETETVKLLDVIDTYYSRNKITDKDELKMIIALWHNAFKSLDFKIVFNLLQQYIEVGGAFAPKIKDLKDMYFNSLDDSKTSGEAWDSLLRNIRRYGYYRVEEGLKELDELTVKALNSIGGYSNLCHSENTVSDRARFTDNYNTYLAQKREDFQIGNLKEKLVMLVEDGEVMKIEG